MLTVCVDNTSEPYSIFSWKYWNLDVFHSSPFPMFELILLLNFKPVNDPIVFPVAQAQTSVFFDCSLLFYSILGHF